MAGAAHITGGGIPGKLGRLLYGTSLGASLDRLFAPADVMLLAQREGNVPDEEAYRVWNMGQGLLIITSAPECVLIHAKRLGFEAQVAGVISKRRGITILSQGHKTPGKSLTFNREA
jgi:phosphoribosylformylglycinamidine cyclo-ligase